jgi:toxin secretion/phage lysis holin
MKKYIDIIAVAIGGGLGYFFGGIDGFMHALTAFVAADYITGVIKAVCLKKLSSEIGFAGLLKKALIFVVVGIAHVMDGVIFEGDSAALRTAVILFYIANEGLSIVENAAVIGLPIPQKLKDVLLQLKDKNSDKNNENDK